MHRNFDIDGESRDLAGSEASAVRPPPLGEPLRLGDIVAVIVSDAGAMRKGAKPHQPALAASLHLLLPEIFRGRE